MRETERKRGEERWGHRGWVIKKWRTGQRGYKKLMKKRSGGESKGEGVEMRRTEGRGEKI